MAQLIQLIRCILIKRYWTRPIPGDRDTVANTTMDSEEGMKLSLQIWKDGKQDGTGRVKLNWNEQYLDI
jgi:hypothetical protein